MPEPSAAALALRQLRRAAGLSQEQLADRCQVSERTIRSLESGNARRPHRDTLAAVAGALALGAQETEAFIAYWRDERRLVDTWFLVQVLEQSMSQEIDRQRSLVRELATLQVADIGGGRRWLRTVSRRTFEVVGESVDEFFWVTGHDPVHIDPAKLRLANRVNLVDVTSFVIPDSGAVAYTALLGRAYSRGEQFAVEYEIDVADAARRDAAVPPDETESLHVTTVPMQMLTTEIRFDVDHLPARAWQVSSDAVDGPLRDVRPLPVTASGLVQAILSPAPAGVHGVRWEWD